MITPLTIISLDQGRIWRDPTEDKRIHDAAVAAEKSQSTWQRWLLAAALPAVVNALRG